MIRGGKPLFLCGEIWAPVEHSLMATEGLDPGFPSHVTTTTIDMTELPDLPFELWGEILQFAVATGAIEDSWAPARVDYHSYDQILHLSDRRHYAESLVSELGQTVLLIWLA